MNELLEQGLAIMGIGIGTVLMFLCTMILAMYIMSVVIKNLNKIFPEAIPQSAGNAKDVSSNDEEVAVAVLAAMLKK